MIKILSDVYESGRVLFAAGNSYPECDATRIQLAVGNGAIVADSVPTLDESAVVQEPVEAVQEAVTASAEDAPVAEPAVVQQDQPRRPGRPRKNGA